MINPNKLFDFSGSDDLVLIESSGNRRTIEKNIV